MEAAIRARDDANDRLAKAHDLVTEQKDRARAERGTIITALKRMRQQNNLAGLLLDTMEREAGGGAGAARG